MYGYLRRCHGLCEKGQIIHLEINAENPRKLGQYKALSYFPHIFSSTQRILVKFGIQGKRFSRRI